MGHVIHLIGTRNAFVYIETRYGWDIVCTVHQDTPVPAHSSPIRLLYSYQEWEPSGGLCPYPTGHTPPPFWVSVHNVIHNVDAFPKDHLHSQPCLSATLPSTDLTVLASRHVINQSRRHAVTPARGAYWYVFNYGTMAATRLLPGRQKPVHLHGLLFFLL